MLLMIPDHKLLYEEKTVETRYVYFQTIWKQWIVFNNRQINFSIDMVQYHANIIPKRGGVEIKVGRSDGRDTACKAGDPGSIPGSGRSPGEGNGNPLQYFCLENFMDRGAWWAIVHELQKVGH